MSLDGMNEDIITFDRCHSHDHICEPVRKNKTTWNANVRAEENPSLKHGASNYHLIKVITGTMLLFLMFCVLGLCRNLLHFMPLWVCQPPIINSPEVTVTVYVGMLVTSRSVLVFRFLLQLQVETCACMPGEKIPHEPVKVSTWP